MSSSAPSTGRSPGASTPPQAQQRAIEIAHRVDVPQAELLGDLGVAHRLGLANPMVARRGASAVCASMAMPGVHVTVVSKPGLSTASHGFGPANDRVAGSGGGINKQGATLPVKWRSLAGLLPGGGLKAAPPLDPPRPSIISPFHPPGQVPRIARGTLESGVVLGEAWSARYGVGLRPSFYSGSLGESLLVLLHGKPLGEALV